MKRYPNRTHYTPHFTRAELDCKCGCATPKRIQRRLRRLAVQLENLRRELGHGVGILSGYRCPAHNRHVGGASDSQHMYGTAADLRVPHGKQGRYVAAAKRVRQFERGGIGVYPHGGVHVDMRGILGRARARWNNWRRT